MRYTKRNIDEAKRKFQSFEGDLYRGNSLKPLRRDFKRHYPIIHNTAELRASLRAGAYAWPGGYPLYFITEDSAALCFDCVHKEYRSISHSIRCKLKDGWRVSLLDTNYEQQELYCDHCNLKINPAYEKESTDE